MLNTVIIPFPVYHAVYLETLELSELLVKISQLFNVEVEKVVDIYFKGPSGIHVLMTSEVSGKYRSCELVS